MARPKQNFKIEIPEKWEDVTLEKFLKVKELYKDNNQPTYIQIIAALSDKDEKYIKDMPSIVFEKLVSKLYYLSEEPQITPSNKIEINGEEYIINTEEHLKTGEFVDVNMVGDNIPAILGILCRKKDEEYNDEFIAKHLDNRIALFNQQPITKIQPLISFFLHLHLTSENTIQKFLVNQYTQVNHILTHTEDLLKRTLGKRRYLSWQMIKLHKLKKSLKRIYQQL